MVVIATRRKLPMQYVISQLDILLMVGFIFCLIAVIDFVVWIIDQHHCGKL
jgi:hypothetical protein